MVGVAALPRGWVVAGGAGGLWTRDAGGRWGQVEVRPWKRRRGRRGLASRGVDRGYEGIRGAGREPGRDRVQGGVGGVED